MTLERQLAQYGRRQGELHGPLSAEELAIRLEESDDPARVGATDIAAAEADHPGPAAHNGAHPDHGDEGELIMMDLQIRETDTDDPEAVPSRRRWGRYVLVAAAAVLLVIVAMSVLSSGDENTTVDPVDVPDFTITLLEADGDAEAQAAFAGVDEAFAAFNSGDMATWAEWRSDGALGGVDAWSYESAAGSHYDVEQCTSGGFGDWQMDEDEVLTGHGFECSVSQTDAVMQAAGIEMQMTHVWVIGEDAESSGGRSNEDFGPRIEFHNEFFVWLSSAHADVFGGLALVEQPECCESYTMASVATAVPTMRDYVDEFVAQSDTYPLTSPVRRLFPLRLVPGEFLSNTDNPFPD